MVPFTGHLFREFLNQTRTVLVASVALGATIAVMFADAQVFSSSLYRGVRAVAPTCTKTSQSLKL